MVVKNGKTRVEPTRSTASNRVAVRSLPLPVRQQKSVFFCSFLFLNSLWSWLDRFFSNESDSARTRTERVRIREIRKSMMSIARSGKRDTRLSRKGSVGNKGLLWTDHRVYVVLYVVLCLSSSYVIVGDASISSSSFETNEGSTRMMPSEYDRREDVLGIDASFSQENDFRKETKGLEDRNAYDDGGDTRKRSSERSESDEDDVEKRWSNWKVTYGYHEGDRRRSEETRRRDYENFKRIDRFVRRHNARADASYTLAHNRHSIDDIENDAMFDVETSIMAADSSTTQRTIEETAPRGYVNTWRERREEVASPFVATDVGDDPGNQSISKDWVELGAVTSVKDQGTSCANGDWAYSAVAAMESGYKVGVLDTYTGPLLNFSSRNLLSCCSLTHQCSGGYPIYSYACIMKNGLCLASDVGDEEGDAGNNLTCTKCDPVVALQGFDVLPRGNESYLLVTVQLRPVSVWVNSASPAFKFYSSGVLDTEECSSGVYGSAVIVGFGYDHVHKKAYWKLKNSWGTRWGEDGYIRLVRDKNMCGVAELAIVPLLVVKANNATLPSRTCDVGYGWADDDRWVCEECAPGTFANGTSICYECDEGQFTNVDGMSSCEDCQEGRVASNTGSSTCQQCEWGLYPDKEYKSCVRCSMWYSISSSESCKSFHLFVLTIAGSVFVFTLCCCTATFWLAKFLRAKQDHSYSETLLMASNNRVRALADGRRIMESEIQFGKVLAIGQEGSVREGLFDGTTKVAVKTSSAPIRVAARDDEMTGALNSKDLGLAEILQSSEYERQLHICMQLRSERIVFFYGCGITADMRLFTVYELMDCALSDELWASRTLTEGEDGETTSIKSVVEKKMIPWRRRLQYALDSAEGMKYLHSRSPPLLHRDLKSLNILVKAGRAKICDFGASKALQTTIFSSPAATVRRSSTWTLSSTDNASRRRRRRRHQRRRREKARSHPSSLHVPLLQETSKGESSSPPTDLVGHSRQSSAPIVSVSSSSPVLSPTTTRTTTAFSSSDSASLSAVWGEDSSHTSDTPPPMMTTKIGTPQWLAPELLCSEKDNKSYSLPIDVYSFGCVLYELLCQKPPWHYGAEKATVIMPHHFHSVFVLQDVLNSGDRPRVPQAFADAAPAGFIELMWKCWSRDPSARPAFDVIFQHLSDIRRRHVHVSFVDADAVSKETEDGQAALGVD